MSALMKSITLDQFPRLIRDALKLAHPTWLPVLVEGLCAMQEADAAYLPSLQEGAFLPDSGRIFAAFSEPITNVRYVLVGEGPYPRAESATGLCFMDGAVHELWSSDVQAGLSKKVNRATSLRNFIKMLLVADGQLESHRTTGEALAQVALKARGIGSPLIQGLPELQANLARQGFLLLNATLVYRAQVKPLKEARAWLPFLQTVLNGLADQAQQQIVAPPTLVLWGKIAEVLNTLPCNVRFAKVISEHPYNLSFITNASMQTLFAPMQLLQK